MKSQLSTSTHKRLRRLNEYVHKDFPDFSIKQTFGVKRKYSDFVSLTCDYIFDLEDGLNAKLKSEKTDEEGNEYDLITLKDLKWFCDIKGVDFQFPKWIKDINIRLYFEPNKGDEKYAGYVTVPEGVKEDDIIYVKESDSVIIKKVVLYVKNVEDIYTTLTHELTHCYDFYTMLKNNRGKGYSQFYDDNERLKDSYSLSHEENLSVYNMKADEFKEIVKEYDENYRTHLYEASLILNDVNNIDKANNLYVLSLLLCKIFYYADMLETKAFYVSVRTKKFNRKYESILRTYKNIREILNSIQYLNIDELEYQCIENRKFFNELTDFIKDIIGVGFKKSFTGWIQEIEFELQPEINDAITALENIKG